MGCVISKDDEGLDIEYKALGFKGKELKKLRKIFDGLESNAVTGLLPIENVIRAWDLEESEIGKHALRIYNSMNTHRDSLEFKEFVLLTWQICNISLHSLTFFVMEMYDVNHTCSLVTEDVVKCLTALKVPAEKILTALHDCPGMDLFDHGRRIYDLDRWEVFGTKYYGFFMNFIDTQIHVRNVCGGKGFWDKIAERLFPTNTRAAITVQKFMDLYVKKYYMDTFESEKKWPCCTLGVIMDGYLEIMAAREELLKLKTKPKPTLTPGQGGTIVPTNALSHTHDHMHPSPAHLSPPGSQATQQHSEVNGNPSHSRPSSAAGLVIDVAGTPSHESTSPNKKKKKNAQANHRVHKEYDAAEDLQMEVERRFKDRDTKNNYDLREHMANNEIHLGDSGTNISGTGTPVNRSRPGSMNGRNKAPSPMRRRSFDGIPGSPVDPMSLVHSHALSSAHGPHALPGAPSPLDSAARRARRNSFG